MKKMTLPCLVLSSILSLSACNRSVTDDNTGKIQESVEKIKAKIQENIPNEATSETPGVEKKDEEKKDVENKKDDARNKPEGSPEKDQPNNNEPNSSD